MDSEQFRAAAHKAVDQSGFGFLDKLAVHPLPFHPLRTLKQRRILTFVLSSVIDYYDNIADLRVTPDLQPGYLRPLLPEMPPQEGEPWEAIQEDLIHKIVPGLTHWLENKLKAPFN